MSVRRGKKIQWLAVAAALAFPAVGWSGTLERFVAPTGDDAASGETGQPWRTLAGAQRKVREWLHDGGKDGGGEPSSMNVNLAPGVYPVDATLQFGPEDSGPAGHWVTYRSAAGGEATLSGARSVPFRVEDERLWEANPGVPLGRLYVRGRACPTAGTSRLTHAEFAWDPVDPKTDSTITVRGLPGGLTNLDGARMLWIDDWRVFRMPVTNAHPGTVSGGEARLQFDPGLLALAFHGHGLRANPKFSPHSVLENVRSALAPGEWWQDPQTHDVLYAPLPGETPSSVLAVAPGLTTLVRVAGTAEKPVRNLRFEHLNFVMAASTPGAQDGFAPAQAGVGVKGFPPASTEKPFALPWSKRYVYTVSAAVSIEHAETVEFLNNLVSHTDGVGLGVSDGCRSVRIVGNAFYDNGAEAVMVGSPLFPGAEGNPALCEQIEVAKNLVRRCGSVFYGCPAITVFYAARTAVQQNDLADLPYTGISFGWGWGLHPGYTDCRDNRITGNRIDNFMRVTRDGGGIYTLGVQPGMVCSGNYITNGMSSGVFGALYHDAGSSLIQTTDNVVAHAFRWLHMHDSDGVEVARNYSDSAESVDHGKATRQHDNTVCADAAWPDAARKIIAAAGIPASEKSPAQTGLEHSLSTTRSPANQ